MKTWKATHARDIDINDETVPPSFVKLVTSQRCALLSAVVEDIYLRFRQQMSFFNHCKLRADSDSAKQRRLDLQNKVREGVLSIRDAASQCGIRACDALNVLVGKKSQRKKVSH